MKVKNIHNIQKNSSESSSESDTTNESLEVKAQPKKTIKGKKKVDLPTTTINESKSSLELPSDIDVKPEKKKRNYVMTEKRLEAFNKMREKLKEKNENKLLSKKIEASKLLLETEHKEKKKSKKVVEEESNSTEEIEIVKIKKPKKKKIIIHESSSEDEEEEIKDEPIKIPDKVMKSQKNRKSNISIKEPVQSNNNNTVSFFI